MEDTHRSQYRLPWSLYEQLKASAEAQRRSINSEIVSRLTISVAQSEQYDQQVKAAKQRRKDGGRPVAEPVPSVEQILAVLRVAFGPNVFTETELLSAAARIEATMQK
ncbi:Arc family DNA-binding protein [Burkholderia gladioli]|uniref:Arc family DNA-binding protein n=1 Tax=Burkholderia gladioli TaxID=28095 RepID=UPI00163FA850|nr:Arc family DNA-binding protein [Burkholderia gladioli]